MADFDWNDLRGFLAIARAGRLTTAAARLNIDHTTLSRRLAALEHALKAKLFDRSPNGYSLTDQGANLLPVAEEMERRALDVQERIGGASTAIEGVVRIGSPEGFGSYFLAPRIAARAAEYPQLRVQLIASPAVFSLARRDADIVVSLSRPPAGRLVASKLTDYDLGLYATPAYLEAHPVKRVDSLRDHRFVSYIRELVAFPELDFLAHVAPGCAISLESSNLVAQLRATLAGSGLCILPAFLAREEPELVHVLPGQVGLTRSLWLVVHQDLNDLARIKAVTRFIRQEVDAAKASFGFTETHRDR